jgi:hypothetical protein
MDAAKKRNELAPTLSTRPPSNLEISDEKRGAALWAAFCRRVHITADISLWVLKKYVINAFLPAS